MTRWMAAAAAAVAALACGAVTGAPVDPRRAPPADQSRQPPAPIVRACVDRNGDLVSTEIVQSSGFPEIDDAALKMARATKYEPARMGGVKKRKSCVKFRVKFVLQDGVPGPAQAARPPRAATAGATAGA